MIWYPWELALDNFLVKALHVIGTEGRNESTHFVKDAAKRPDITLAIVWLILPDLRASIIRRACLSVAETFLDDLGDVQITKLRLHVLKEE